MRLVAYVYLCRRCRQEVRQDVSGNHVREVIHICGQSCEPTASTDVLLGPKASS